MAAAPGEYQIRVLVRTTILNPTTEGSAWVSYYGDNSSRRLFLVGIMLRDKRTFEYDSQVIKVAVKVRKKGDQPIVLVSEPRLNLLEGATLPIDTFTFMSVLTYQGPTDPRPVRVNPEPE
jgi:hypothetical protein